MQVFNKKDKDSNTEINKEKPYKGESYEMVVRHVKRSALAGLIASAVVLLIAAYSVMAPYAVAINGKTVCYVKNKEESGKVASAIIKEYLPEDAVLNAVDVSDNITFELADVKSALKADCVSVEEAAEILKDRDMLASGSEFTDRYYASDMSDNFIAMTDMLFADTDFKIHLLKLEE